MNPDAVAVSERDAVGPASFERIAVIGLGYVGLPLAIDLATAGHDVLGVDASTTRIAKLQRGDSYIDDVSPDRLIAVLESGQFVPVTPEVGWDEHTISFMDISRMKSRLHIVR